MEIDNRSLIYQMPDRPYIAPEVFKRAGVMIDVFPVKYNDDLRYHLWQKQTDIQGAMVCLTGATR